MSEDLMKMGEDACNFYLILWELDLIDREEGLIHSVGLHPSAELWNKVYPLMNRMVKAIPTEF